MSDAKSSGGVGFFGLLTLLFIGLKLGGAISWSWWWVLSPVWIIGSFVALCILCIGILYLIKEMK